MGYKWLNSAGMGLDGVPQPLVFQHPILPFHHLKFAVEFWIMWNIAAYCKTASSW